MRLRTKTFLSESGESDNNIMKSPILEAKGKCKIAIVIYNK